MNAATAKIGSVGTAIIIIGTETGTATIIIIVTGSGIATITDIIRLRRVAVMIIRPRVVVTIIRRRLTDNFLNENKKSLRHGEGIFLRSK